jgi:hypothetical protein
LADLPYRIDKSEQHAKSVISVKDNSPIPDHQPGGNQWHGGVRKNIRRNKNGKRRRLNVLISGGKKSGSGSGKKESKASSRKGGRKGGRKKKR